jgi:hypothetical protein
MGLAIHYYQHQQHHNYSSPQGTRGFEMLLLSLKAQQKHHRNINQILCYARKYGSILQTGDASPLTSLTGPQRRHAMEALTVLSKQLGCYDRWLAIRKRYSLHWTNGNESLQALERFFNTAMSLDHMIEKVKGRDDV